MSRDTSQREQSDRRLWLKERCPHCGAQPGARCHNRTPARRKPPPTVALHAARGWRQRPCPSCKASAGEECLTPHGRPAARPHTVRLRPARDELHALQDVWRALERAGAEIALVRFAGGGGRQGTIDNLTIETAGRELARFWTADESELASALAAPAWARYGAFRGLPRIAATLAWSVAERSLMLAGTRGSERFQETLPATTRTSTHTIRDTSRDTSSPINVGDHPRPPQANTNPSQAAARECCRCDQPIPATARPEARYCSKRCRQSASRASLREQSGRAALSPPERCDRCDGPMPKGLRPEARYCSKRCRQAASRARIALSRGQDPGRAESARLR
jgi:hypothetical protein